MHGWLINAVITRLLGWVANNESLAHLDFMGSLMILLVGFGWAKPVPVDSRNLKNPRVDVMRTLPRVLIKPYSGHASWDSIQSLK